MPKGPAISNQAAPNSQLRRKKKYSAPQCIPLTSNDESKAEIGRSRRSRRETIVGADCPTRGWQAGAEMIKSGQDRTENIGVFRSQWKSAAVVVLILASIAMPWSTMLQLKGGSSIVRVPPLLLGF